MKRFCLFGCLVAALAALGCDHSPCEEPRAVSVAPKTAKQLPPTDSDREAPARPSSAEAGKAPQKSSGGEKLLTPNDFTFLGSYPFSADNQATFGMGLTHRRVNGQLRFLTFSYDGKVRTRLIEFALPARVGQPITRLTATWDDIWSPAPHPNLGGGDEYGLWWEDQGNGKGRLWTTHCTDYPNDKQIHNTQALALRGLNADGTVSEVLGEYGLQGVSQRAIYGGVQRIPHWFRDKFKVSQPYAVGWGGYTSRMAQGLVPSMGLMVLAVTDVTTYKPDSVIPATDFLILADHRSGTTAARDWYAARQPTRFDRGRRNSDVVNYYDGGNVPQKPGSPPAVPPAAGAQWLSPAPDGVGRFVWGDSYYNTGCWIDGPNKGGFVVIGSFARGKAFYQGSTLNSVGRHAELQVFDPNDFGEVLRGKRQPWNVQPAASKLLTEDLVPLRLLFGPVGNNASGAIAGATFDPETRHLYLWCPNVNRGYGCCLVVYKVNC